MIQLKLGHIVPKIALACCALTPLFTSRSVAAPAAPKLPPSGRIAYNMTNPMASGTLTLSWAGGGTKLRHDMTMKMKMQMPQNMRSDGGPANNAIKAWTIYDGTYAYTLMPTQEKRVIRKRLTPEQSRAVMMSSMNPMGSRSGAGKMVGKGQVLGKTCDIRQVVARGRGGAKSNTKVWVWQGLPLRVESTIQFPNRASGSSAGAGKNARGAASEKFRTFKTLVVATKLDTAAKISPALFKVPAGYTIKDAPRPAAPRRVR